MTQKKVLLVNPQSNSIYANSIVKNSAPLYAPLTLATLAASLRENNIEVKVLDLNLHENDIKGLSEALWDYKPDNVAITFTTPLYNNVKNLCKVIRKFDSDIKIILGGAHVTALPMETLMDMGIDVAIIGEGDYSLPEVVKNLNENVKGIFYRGRSYNILTDDREYIEDLDALPMPAWDLFEVNKYKNRQFCRKTPVGPIETSRGCVGRCTYCSKKIFGYKFRAKSVKRVVGEMEYLLSVGFKEIHIQDDCFSTDLQRAKDVCKLIIKRNLDFPWSLPSGIRCNGVDQELFDLMYKSGCYRVSFGIESGNQHVLNGIKKGITLNMVRSTVKMANDTGLETLGYFMMGLPDDTEKTMEDTIEFAKKLDLDICKFDKLTPLPGTELFWEYEKKGLIVENDWGNYNYHSKKCLFKHPNLSNDSINNYYNKAYKGFYMRPKYIAKRLCKDIRSFEAIKGDAITAISMLRKL